jgi:hypothetical protein
MNKNVLIAIAIATLTIGTVAMFAIESISVRDVLNALSGMSPRVMSLAVLPLIIVLVVIGIYLRKKNEERMWKNAVLKTKANRQQGKD